MREKTTRFGQVSLSEKDFQSQVIQIAEWNGWLIYHVPDSRLVTCRGYLDLTLLHPTKHRLLMREIKTDTGRIRPEQHIWLDGLRACGIDAGVWRPKDWPLIEETLKAA